MRSARLWILLLAVAAASGCVTYERGRLAAASTRPISGTMTVVAEDVEGRSCDEFAANRYQVAVEDALRNAPGANALLNPGYRSERFCIVVRGAAVRLP